MWRRQTVKVDVTQQRARYEVLSGQPVEVFHYGQSAQVSPDAAVERPIPSVQAGPRPTQPVGREPARRGGVAA
jgi:alpha,alpha-trehalose phosphorylase